MLLATRRCVPGGAAHAPSTVSVWRGRRQRHRRRGGREQREQLVECVPALPGRGESLPVGDRKVDRRERARAQDRAGDDDAGGCLLVDHKPGPHSEHGRLQEHAQYFRDRGKPAGDVAGLLLAGDEFPVGLAPARAQPAVHAHRNQRLGVASARFGETVTRDAEPDRLLARVARIDLGQYRERAQDDRAHQGGDADQRVEREADDEIERDPGQVEECDRSHAGEEGPQIVEVAQRLQAVAAIARLQRHADQRVVDAVADRLVEAGADPHQDAAADQIEHAERGVKRGRDGDERDQGRHAVARQHAVIDLQHEDRAGEHQHVAHAAEHGGRDERAAAGGQRRG